MRIAIIALLMLAGCARSLWFTENSPGNYTLAFSAETPEEGKAKLEQLIKEKEICKNGYEIIAEKPIYSQCPGEILMAHCSFPEYTIKCK